MFSYSRTTTSQAAAAVRDACGSTLQLALFSTLRYATGTLNTDQRYKYVLLLGIATLNRERMTGQNRERGVAAVVVNDDDGAVVPGGSFILIPDEAQAGFVYFGSYHHRHPLDLGVTAAV